LSQELEVHDSDVPQLFRIQVRRIRFTCEIMLRTQFEEPAPRCPFRVKDIQGATICTNASTEIGVAICDLPVGTFLMKLEPSDESPFVYDSIEVHVREDGTFEPLEWRVPTKVTDVKIHLVTPDGEPAAHCAFYLEPQFPEAGVMGRAREMKCHSDDAGVAVATMGLLEPYVFRVKAIGKDAEYMPQQFVFQTDRRHITAVVARSIFGPVLEEWVVLVIDTSGSMQVYLDDIKAALNGVIVEQFHKSEKLFNIISFTGINTAFRGELVDCSQQNLEDALRFCSTMEAGGGSDLLGAIEHSFRFQDVQAVYLVTDGKCEINDSLLNRLRALYFAHPGRPKVHAIGINCVPRRLTWQGLQALSLLTQGSFRSVCLEQAVVDLAAQHAMGLATNRSSQLLDIGTAGIAAVAGKMTSDEDTGAGEDGFAEDSG